MPPTEAGRARLYMDAVITPNRSLSPRGLTVLLCLFSAYNIVLAVFLIVVGAFPVPIFLGLDVIGLFIAFHVSNRRARRAERVQVSAEDVRVVRQKGGQPQTVWTSPTAFTRVWLGDDPDTPEVQLRLSGRSLVVADALSPNEKTDFARALEHAIHRARSERYA